MLMLVAMLGSGLVMLAAGLYLAIAMGQETAATLEGAPLAEPQVS
jgi:hypothetical protein